MRTCLLLIILITSLTAQNSHNEIKVIQDIQKQIGADSWTPGVTSLSHLNQQQFAKLCGVLLQPKEDISKDLQLPEMSRYTLDLRSSKYLTGIRSQGKCGSCWAFAIVAAMEFHYNGRYDMSEQHLVDCCNSSAGCNGGVVSWSLKWIISKGGVHSEVNYPYSSGETGKTGPCDNMSGTKYTLKDYVFLKTADDIMRYMSNYKRPVITAMQVYEDFRHYTGGVYKHVNGGFVGGHAILIVGYNSTEKYWIAKNSWGDKWGENGYFKIAFGQCSMASYNSYYVK